MQFNSLSRRRLLLAGAAAAVVPAAALAQPGKAAVRTVTIAQVVDVSAAQQDISKDFLVGSRAAWQDVNSRGGLRGRHVHHLVIEVDGTAEAVRAAVLSLREQPGCVALCGTAGDLAATRVAQALRRDRVAIAHAAPWLQNSTVDIDDATFPVFATRQEQIAHALKSLAVMSVTEVAVVYASTADDAAYRHDLARSAAELKLKLHEFRGGSDLVRLGQKLTPSTPAILLFVGGTPELAQFTQGLEKQSRQRYVVALADVNLQALKDLGAARATPVIATQAVPLVTASMPIVRRYRDVLGRLFDEPPTPLSLAGFIAARYAVEVLGDVDPGALSRATALAAFQRHGALDLGGLRIAADGRRRGSTFVTQSMLTVDGRFIG